MSYTIIDVERQTGISSRTLRFWASKGLFPFTQLSEHGTRYFAYKFINFAKFQSLCLTQAKPSKAFAIAQAKPRKAFILTQEKPRKMP